MGEKEIDAIASTILANWDVLTSAKSDEKKLRTFGDELKKKLDGGKAADLALFGRMLADLPDKNIDAACQVAHAISTHKVGVEFDFYTAMDDLPKENETGAGMMGTVEFNSACYYRYASIDLEQLKNNLGGDAELSKKTVEAFIRASVAAIPTGKQNSFSAQNPPDFVMAVVRDRNLWSLANAFSRPVKEDGGLMENSINALVEYWNRLTTAFPDKDIKEKNIKVTPVMTLFTDKEVKLNGLQKVSNFEELVAVVNKAIAGDC
jgi:CRISPR system Cascade subunit CasC